MTCELCFYSVRFRVVCVFREAQVKDLGGTQARSACTRYPLKTKESHRRKPSLPRRQAFGFQPAGSKAASMEIQFLMRESDVEKKKKMYAVGVSSGGE